MRDIIVLFRHGKNKSLYLFNREKEAIFTYSMFKEGVLRERCPKADFERWLPGWIHETELTKVEVV